MALAPRPRILRDTRAAAEHAALRYVSCTDAGIRRVRQGRGFRYRSPKGGWVTDSDTLGRIRSLAIPPAWRDVWICADARGHLQATGRDARGRRQYRYHPRWRDVRDEAKYQDVIAFAKALPRLRRRVERDLARRVLDKDKVLATVVRMLEKTFVRVGNDRYAESNGSYGLTTLLDRHARVGRSTIEFRFRGKGGKPYRTSVCDARLAAIVRRCRDIPGQRLFQYYDARGHCHPVTSTDVNDYLCRATGQRFTAKTFRTWAGTLAATSLLAAADPKSSERGVKAAVRDVIGRVAEQLGNTPAVCRKSYIHPAVLDAFASGRLGRDGRKARRRAPVRGLTVEERALLALLDVRRAA